MKVAIVLFALVAFASAASLRPVEKDEELPRLTEQSEETETEVRFKRATCDLLSVSTPWGSLNHAACAAHCIAMNKGFKGGRCIDGVCNCRK